MRFLVLLSVVVASTVGQGFLRDTPEVEAARNAFVREYNRIALLSAQSQDTGNFNEEPPRRLRANSGRQRQAQPRRQPQVEPQVEPLVEPQVEPQVEPRRQPQTFAARPTYTPAADAFSYSVNLGTNQQFHPGPRTFPAAPTFNAARTFPAARTFSSIPTIPAASAFPAPQPVTHRFAPAPVARWTGPQADTIPAGVGGGVTDTKDVAAAKAAHLQAVAAALGYHERNFAA
ncbi:guanine nucleotide-binding protein G(s) subunit alpha isoforms XLas [Procambarus clarkii]|uniref:guanine nucleotide-binding protein G(s) subunit alpha isoforms XLas n=1 Tax=Procambarus clarkii TaxID=6728 RepID=UPI001E677117|nr:guanine nucleotide-binding protein G(s) subunit alpha isoforms XLas-like [Procambarus clarkii]